MKLIMTGMLNVTTAMNQTGERAQITIIAGDSNMPGVSVELLVDIGAMRELGQVLIKDADTISEIVELNAMWGAE